MRQITINIPENKVSFFRELIDNLGGYIEGESGNTILTPEQIELVNIERRKVVETPEDFTNWEDVHKKMMSR